MKVQIVIALVLLALALFAQANTHQAPPCIRARTCQSKDWVAVDRAQPNHILRLIVPVTIANLDRLQATVNKISNPRHSEFNNLLTFDQLGKIIRNEEAISAISAYFTAHGVAFEVLPNGDYFVAYTTVATAERLFNAEFHVFQSEAKNHRVVRAFEYTVPVELVDFVNFIGGIVSFPITLRPNPVITAFQSGRPMANNTVTPALLDSYYSVASNTIQNAQTTQSLFESLGQSYSPSDLAQFQQTFNIPSQKIANVVGKNSPTSCTADPNNCVEANLDVQYIIAMAQGAPTTYWSIPSNDENIFLDWILAVAQSSNPPLVHSISYGSIESEESQSELQQFDQEAMKLGSRGVTIMSSSGDDGVANFVARNNSGACGFNPSFPATATNVLAVGATQGPESGNPEIGCSSATGGIITSGGGFSTVFNQPSYQTSAVAAYFQTNVTFPPSGQYNGNGRGYPDVAMLGYNYEVVIAGQVYGVSGTSCSSPVFAGLVSLANDARITAGKNPIGLLNQVVYNLDPSTFNDITSGENNCCAGSSNPVCCQYGFYAAAGWDPMTGLGSIHFDKFLSAITNA